MLKINIISVGKIKDKYITDGINEFKKRLNSYCKLEETVLKESKVDSVDAAKVESKLIINAMEKQDYNIALAINANQLSSEEFGSMFDKLAVDGVSSIGFVIGSSHGLDKEVYDLVDKKISFSKMTFPHQMFKLLLIEQIYRGFSIINNGKYHK
jgi:23S rRNA (pseudouridine1915-N3)-methyltransferase